jgi:hypothetical protein
MGTREEIPEMNNKVFCNFYLPGQDSLEERYHIEKDSEIVNLH